MNRGSRATPLSFLLALLALGVSVSTPGGLRAQYCANPPQSVRPPSTRNTPLLRNGNQDTVDQLIQRAVEQMAVSGRVLANEGSPSIRLARLSEIPPGRAPLLSFRIFDRDLRYRLGKLDLVVDDAGH